MSFDLRNFVEQGVTIIKEMTPRRDSGPIETVADMRRFAVTRAAFIAQRTMFGYVKTRMGIRYPEMFRDDAIIASVNIAKMHHFSACLSDLCVFVVKKGLPGPEVGDAGRSEVAMAAYAEGLEENADPSIADFSPGDAVERFRQRLDWTDWAERPTVRGVFTQSQISIVQWAPIADELKQYDQEIVENSVRFAWIDVVTKFEKRLRADAVVADHLARAPGLTPVAASPESP